MVDCRDREEWPIVMESMEEFVLAPHELQGVPLLIMANFHEAEVSCDRLYYAATYHQ